MLEVITLRKPYRVTVDNSLNIIPFLNDSYVSLSLF